LSPLHHGTEEPMTDLETSGTPIHKLNGSLGFNACNRSLDILRHDVTTI
jgi:hypothetical protein